ncbi:MAG: ComEC/Rec2 family competence protein [Bacteroidales bacterium]|nr:ComEC/Rec2 family competence protein [Bacteroidales bacterium]
MKNKSGIILVSLPFAAGVSAAALLSRPYPCATVCSCAAVLLFYLCFKDGKRRAAGLYALFFALGALCWCTDALRGVPANPGASPAMDYLCRRIDGAGFPGEHSAAILKALLTGRRSALDRSVVEIFRSSGASHILALSGLHLGVLYLLVRRLLSPIGNSLAARVIKSVITVSFSAFYAFATGASPSIIRALLFISINEAASFCPGRERTALGTFCAALTLQLILKPGYISSAGFQLSYLAMTGITLVYPYLEQWYPGRRGPLKRVWQCAALSISCQLFTAPVAWAHFHSFPKYFLITNLLAMPLTGLIIPLAAGSLALDAAGICPPVLIRACGLMVQCLEFCLETIASI